MTPEARLRAALQRIAEYETDWTQGPAANVAALQAIAEAALLGQPRDAATGEFVPSSTVEGMTTLGTNSPPARPPLEPPPIGKPGWHPCNDPNCGFEFCEAARRPPEVPTCASWCGTDTGIPGPAQMIYCVGVRGMGAGHACYCTADCRDNRHPRRPERATPTDVPTHGGPPMTLDEVAAAERPAPTSVATPPCRVCPHAAHAGRCGAFDVAFAPDNRCPCSVDARPPTSTVTACICSVPAPTNPKDHALYCPCSPPKAP